MPVAMSSPDQRPSFYFGFQQRKKKRKKEKKKKAKEPKNKITVV